MVEVASKATILTERTILSILEVEKGGEIVEVRTLKVNRNGMVITPPCKPTLAH